MTGCPGYRTTSVPDSHVGFCLTRKYSIAGPAGFSGFGSAFSCFFVSFGLFAEVDSLLGVGELLSGSLSETGEAPPAVTVPVNVHPLTTAATTGAITTGMYQRRFISGTYVLLFFFGEEK